MERISEKQRKFILGTLHQLNLDNQRFRIIQECEGIIKINSLNQMSYLGLQNMVNYLTKEAEKQGVKLLNVPTNIFPKISIEFLVTNLSLKIS